eukprot:gene30818-40120_t
MIIRDPIDRLVSAFNHHAACPNISHWEGRTTRTETVPQLLELRGTRDALYSAVMDMDEAARCLSFPQFVRILGDIHQHPVKEHDINGHFSPQIFDCFIEERVHHHNNRTTFRIDPTLWTAVGSISNSTIFQLLYEHLMGQGLQRRRNSTSTATLFAPPPKRNLSPDIFRPQKRELEMLVEITKLDYCVLGRYLEQPCRYQQIIGGEDLRYRFLQDNNVNGCIANK